MSQYDTLVKQVTEDVTVTISKKKGATAGERLEAFLKWLAGAAVDPDYGIEEGHPDQGLPGAPPTAGQPLPGQPPTAGQPLPGQPGKPDQSLPGSQPGVDNTLPGSQPGVDNELPKIIGEHAKEIAKLILGKCYDCKDDTAGPK
jgi:hypothetical protein